MTVSQNEKWYRYRIIFEFTFTDKPRAPLEALHLALSFLDLPLNVSLDSAQAKPLDVVKG